jgi:diaminopimelate decarboxylase
LEHVDLGGGLGIIYNNEKPVPITEYAEKILEKMKGRSEKLMFEPGRFLVGNSGVFLTRTEYVKKTEHKYFAVVDGAMNDLLRPAIYKVYHEIVNTTIRNQTEENPNKFDVVGPVCETTDFFGKNRNLVVEEGDIIAILSAGAYCFSMSSNYNSRPRPSEILVDGKSYKLIRQRETMEDVIRNEIIPQ